MLRYPLPHADVGPAAAHKPGALRHAGHREEVKPRRTALLPGHVSVAPVKSLSLQLLPDPLRDKRCRKLVRNEAAGAECGSVATAQLMLIFSASTTFTIRSSCSGSVLVQNELVLDRAERFVST